MKNHTSLFGDHLPLEESQEFLGEKNNTKIQLPTLLSEMSLLKHEFDLKWSLLINELNNKPLNRMRQKGNLTMTHAQLNNIIESPSIQAGDKCSSASLPINLHSPISTNFLIRDQLIQELEDAKLLLRKDQKIKLQLINKLRSMHQEIQTLKNQSRPIQYEKEELSELRTSQISGKNLSDKGTPVRMREMKSIVEDSSYNIRDEMTENRIKSNCQISSILLHPTSEQYFVNESIIQIDEPHSEYQMQSEAKPMKPLKSKLSPYNPSPGQQNNKMYQTARYQQNTTSSILKNPFVNPNPPQSARHKNYVNQTIIFENPCQKKGNPTVILAQSNSTKDLMNKLPSRCLQKVSSSLGLSQQFDKIQQQCLKPISDHVYSNHIQASKQLSKTNIKNNSQRHPTPQRVFGKENNTSSIDEKKSGPSKLVKFKSPQVKFDGKQPVIAENKNNNTPAQSSKSRNPSFIHTSSPKAKTQKAQMNSPQVFNSIHLEQFVSKLRQPSTLSSPYVNIANAALRTK